MNMKNIKGRRMPFENEIEYTRDLMENHPDPSAEWGGGGDADVAKEVQDTAAGQIGVVKVVDEEDYATLFLGIKGENDAFYKNYVDVSSDGTVALKADDSFEFGVQGNKGSFFAAKENDIELTPDYGYDVNIKVGNGGKLCVTQTGQGTLVKKQVALDEDIPTNVSDLTNDAGYITSSDISNMVTTDTNQTISGEKTFTSEIKVTDLQGLQTELHKDKLIFHGNGTTNLLPNYNAASYGSDVDVTLPATPGTLALQSELPDAVSGTNDGTNWTSLTIGNDTYGVGGGSTPSNMVTIDTNQQITGRKDFDVMRNVNFIANSSQINFGYINSTYPTTDPQINFKIYNQYSGSSSKAAKFSFKSSNPDSGGGSNPTFTERAYLSVYGNGNISLRNDVSGATSDASIVIANKAGNGLYFYDTVTRFRTISGNLLVVPDEAGTLVTTNKVPDAPTTDGTYVLEATVSNGTATYAWVLKS